jgi:RNA polymerase sigma factor (sigma-70 family)
MNIIVIVFSTFFTTILSYKMITKPQWNYYQSVLISKHISESMREKINYILFMRHQPLINRMGRDFMGFHKHKSKYIHYDDVVQQGSYGLLHAIKNYNGKSSFYRYAQIYIKGAMYKALTNNYPISQIPKKERAKNKIVKYTDFESCGPKDRHRNIYLGKRNFIKSSYDSQYLNAFFHDCLTKWKEIHNLPPFMMRIMYQKYDFEFNIVRSNNEISRLNGCSEETIRQNVKKALIKLNIL